MCGRYVSATPVEELARYFSALPDDDLGDVARARYNVPPTEQVLGVVEEQPRQGTGPRSAATGGSGDGESTRSGHAEPLAGATGALSKPDGGAVDAGRRLRAYRWGLVPPWAKDLAAGNRAFNARAETLATRPAFRSAFRERRVLLPASAFYEWRRLGGRRQPFAFCRADGAPIALAGLWERWRDPESGLWLRSCTIVTTDAGPDVAAVHDRQPVVVEPGDFEPWLDCRPRAVPSSELERILTPSAGGTLASYPVDTAVGRTTSDGPRLLEPVEIEGWPPGAGAKDAPVPAPGADAGTGEQLSFAVSPARRGG